MEEEEHFLLAPWLDHFICYITGPPAQEQHHHNGLGPSSIINEENAPIGLSMGQS